VLFIPGVHFGPIWCFILNLAGDPGRNGIPSGRSLRGGVLIRQKAGTRLERLIKGVEVEGWRLVGLTRLVPLFPFD
jgi:uncharacterized membrane protein YdjX (TVP38/TMEM64 family)